VTLKSRNQATSDAIAFQRQNFTYHMWRMWRISTGKFM